ncbi:pentapeptide repeat-containing protein [Anaerosporomusa subterranea]|uniref:pentapeptide repeat-containing protein n=1 Tax=Anaerosporomusa subterranea TaxID=1794912 RepID=UPI0018D4803D
MHQVEIKNCKILGINLLGATLRNVLFDNCYGDYATFRNVNCKQVKFHNSSLANADFYKSTLLHVHFSNSSLDQIQLSGTKLAGIDLSSCEFRQIGVTIEDVQGCIVSPQQAVGFSKLFGLIIKD